MKIKYIVILIILILPIISYSQFSEKELHNQRWEESRHFNDRVSHKGAIGVAQFIPSTWNWLKKEEIIHPNLNIENEEHQIIAQEAYLIYLYNLKWRDGIDKKKAALASYNWGRRKVLNLISKHGLDWEEHIPQEVKHYIKNILKDE